MVEGSFSKATDSGRQVSLECAEQAPWGLSVGVQSQPEVFGSPKHLTVNGQSMTVQSVLRSPRLREISFVPVAADESATVVSVFSQEAQESSLVELTELQDRLASEAALNAELTHKLSAALDDKAQAIATLTGMLEAEEEKCKAQFARANELEAELHQFKSNVRLEAVKALFSDLHRDYADEAAAPYLEMSEASFAAIANDLRSLKAPNLNESLFKDVAVKGAVPEKSETEWASQLFAQVSGVK
jgi:hypothetical protein